MQIRTYFTLILLFVCSGVFAADTIQMFASKNECLRHFTISSGTSDIAKGEEFCRNRVTKSAVDICADKKLLEFKMKNSISSVDEARYALKFRNDCIVAASATPGAANQLGQTNAQATERQNQIDQQQAQVLAQKQQAEAQQLAAKQKVADQKKQQQNAHQSADTLNALVPVLDKVARDYDKASAKQATSTDIPLAGSQVTPFGGSVEGSINTAITSVNANLAADVEKRAAAEKAREDVARDVEGGSGSDASELAKVQAEAAQHQAQIAKEIDGAKKDLPGLNKELDGVEGATKAGDSTPPTSEITASSQKANGELTSSIEKSMGEVTNSYSSNTTQSMPWEQTYQAISQASEIVKSYTAEPKIRCTSLTEKTEFLCLEGSSPGMQATKTLMSAAGPILAAVGSAQKACNNTSKVAGLAGGAVMLAKGVCMASQMACTGACGTALTTLTSKMTALNSKTMTGLQSDFASGQSLCASLASSVVTSAQGVQCYKEINAKMIATKKALAEIQAALKNEAAPTPGTAAGLAIKCKMKATDILAMAANAAALFAAKASAKECDKKLAADGLAGGSVTPTQFCENPANSQGQFCKCQQNNNQQGCPGFAGSGTIIDKDGKGSSIAGPNIKTGAGLSSFAGGKAGTPGFNGGLNSKTPTTAAEQAAAEKLALGGPDSGAAGAGTGTGGGFGGGAGAAGGAGAGPNDKNKPDTKKWSFGEFANALGGMFGGGKSGSGKGNGANGNLSASQKAAIQRKIASDRVAAEVTSASGKSNWEKVHQVYLIKDSTLINGQ